MKVCTIAHEAAGFGFVPVGSLWDDDSPYLTDDNAAFFDDVELDYEEPAPKPAVRKFKAKDDD